MFGILINVIEFYFCFREYLDLSRNQNLLKQLVTRKGLPVLDSIPSGLQKIKGILSGKPACQDLPKNLGSRLM